MSYLTIGCTALFIAVFAISGVGKLRDRAAFASSVRSIVGTRWPVSVAMGVAIGELGVVVLLVAAPVSGLVVASVVLAGFCAVVAGAVRRGVRQPCHCFGPSSTPLGRRHFVRAGLLSLLAATGAAGGRRAPAWVLDGLHPAGVAIAMVVAAVLVVLTVSFDDVVDLFHPTVPRI